MIVDLLADSSLPHSVTSALKVISDMLSPLLQQNFNRNSFSTSLVTVLEKTQVHVDEASVKDQPDLKDDTPLSLKTVSNFVLFANKRLIQAWISFESMQFRVIVYHLSSTPMLLSII